MQKEQFVMTAKILYFFGLVSIVASVYIYNQTDPMFGMYIGLWSPTFLVMATYQRVMQALEPSIDTNGLHPKWQKKG